MCAATAQHGVLGLGAPPEEVRDYYTIHRRFIHK